VAITFDGSLRLIYLDGAPSVSIREIYSRWVDWVAQGDNLKWLPAFSTVADPPIIPLYATLLHGWCISPLAGTYTLRLTDGFIYDADGGEPVCEAHGVGQEPRVRYEQPVIAVGYATGESPQQADIDAIRAVTDALTIEAGRVLADLRAVRGQAISGTGSEADPWGP
jgi:hypothetical protein